MWTLHTANEEHWVPIDTIVSFKRMREFQSRGVPWVADVLRTSDELEVSEDATKVRRCTEVQEPKGAFERSVYAVRFVFKGLLVLLSVANRAYRKASVKNFQVFN
jgi:lupus La protein